MLSSFYLLALAGVGIAILATLIGAVVSVSRKPPWSVERPALANTDEIDSASHGVDRLPTQQVMPSQSHTVEHKNREIEQVM